MDFSVFAAFAAQQTHRGHRPCTPCRRSARLRVFPAALADGRQYVHMNGREVFKFATRVVGQASRQALARADMTLDELDWIIPHQANLRIIQAAARDMKLPLDRFIVNIERYGNTSAASIPLALVESLEEGRVKPDDHLLMVAFGAGLTWGAAVLQMAPTLSANGQTAV